MPFHMYGSLFDGYHLGYILISLGLTSSLLFLASRFITKHKHKELFLKTWAWATVFLHISPIWISFLRGEPAIAADNVLFPIYFCNMSMYFLVIVAIWGDKTTKTFKYLATMAAYSGVIGALISLFYPEYYLNGTSMFEWGVFKSMLSHSTMLLGSAYLFVGGYVKIERMNTVIYAIGLLFVGLIGLIVNGVFALAGLNPPNAMYLQHPPIAEAPFLNVYVIVILMLIVIYGFTSIVEMVRKQKKQAAPALAKNS